MGEHIASLVPSGDVALFIATPGALNIQPRIDGAQDTLKTHPGIKTQVVATGAALTQELSAVDSFVTANPSTRASSPSTPAAPRASARRSRSTT